MLLKLGKILQMVKIDTIENVAKDWKLVVSSKPPKTEYFTFFLNTYMYSKYVLLFALSRPYTRFAFAIQQVIATKMMIVTIAME